MYCQMYCLMFLVTSKRGIALHLFMACEACILLNGMREHWWSVLAQSFLSAVLLTVVTLSHPSSLYHEWRAIKEVGLLQ
jgi:hypothetical protein